jgi:hypothetical protein
MRKHHRELDASVEASGPHAFAVRDPVVRRDDQFTSTASLSPTFRDDREAPLCSGWDGASF